MRYPCRFLLSNWICEDVKEHYPSILKGNAEISSLKEEMQRLQKDIYQLRIEKDILEKAAELLKKDESIDINDLTNKEKTIIINALRDQYQLKVLLKSLKIAKSSYFYQLSALLKNKICKNKKKE